MQCILLKHFHTCKSVPGSGNVQKHRNLGAKCKGQTCLSSPHSLLVSDHIPGQVFLVLPYLVNQAPQDLLGKPDPDRRSPFQPFKKNGDVHHLFFYGGRGQALLLQLPDGTKYLRNVVYCRNDLSMQVILMHAPSQRQQSDYNLLR